MRPRSSHPKPHQSQLRPDGTTFPPVTPDPPPPPGWVDPFTDLDGHSEPAGPEAGERDDTPHPNSPRRPGDRDTRVE